MIDAIRYDGLYQMPPKQKLPMAEIELLEDWVRRGAPWALGDVISPKATEANFDLLERRRTHWAWKPIAVSTVPVPKDGGGNVSAIDAFLQSKLDEAGIAQVGPADRWTLLRRATFDLIGLPPTFEEIQAFQADTSPDAFEKVVDRLLTSPHFGERWGRHWLDLVRYAETLGHEFDYPLTEAWRYRDYVIRALNADVPYDQFLREHIAGDLLIPPRLHPTEGFNESIIATAFWYLGEAIHAPVDSQADQAVRIDNQIDVVSKTFLGLTVACARCHDHKFDAISTKDYYAMAGYAASSHQQQALLDPGGRITSGVRRLAELQQVGRDLWGQILSETVNEGRDKFARCLMASRAARGITNGAALDEIARLYRVEHRLVESFVAASDAAQDPQHPLFAWNKLAGGSLPEDSFLTRRSVIEAAMKQRIEMPQASADGELVYEDFSRGFEKWFPTGWAFGQSPTKHGHWAASSNGPQLLAAGMAHSGQLGAKLQGVIRSSKFTVEKPYIHYRLCGRDAEVRLVVDGYMMTNFSELLFEGLSFKVDADDGMHWHVQSVAKYLGHRAHFEISDLSNGFVAVDEIRFSGPTISDVSDDSINRLILAQPSVVSTETLAEAYGDLWIESFQDWLAGKRSSRAEFVRWATAHGLASINDVKRAALIQIVRQAAAIDSALSTPDRVVAIADGSGEDQRVQIRGSHQNLGEVVPRRFLEAIAGRKQEPHLSGSGRLELAERMLSPDNPFTARVMANRVWSHLFGRGIVATVDNFGVLGERPTHPELLDYLATRLRTDGWSLKSLIREIMMSRAYQMKSDENPLANERDPSNLFLHCANVRRLEGESIRDALIAISGRLDPKLYGPSIPIHLTGFMEGRGRPAQSGPLDGAGRRTIYVEVRRNFLSPFLLAFNTPLPASTVGKRHISNVPAQALILMNDPFVLEQCQRWAKRALTEADFSHDDRIRRLYLTAFGRPPSPEEIDAATSFLAEQARAYGGGLEDDHPWIDLCHVLVNVKEFVFIP
jgi:hypothetical protein